MMQPVQEPNPATLSSGPARRPNRRGAPRRLADQREAEHLRQTSPERFAQFQALDHAALNVKAQAAEYQQRQQFAQSAEAADRAFAEQHKELENPQVRETLRAGAMEYLQKGLGLTPEQINHAWNVTGELRSVPAQNMLLNATRQYLAQKGVSTRPRPSVPKVQRPGAAGTRATASEVRIAELSERLNATGNLRDAAKLVATRRSAR